MTDAVKKTRAPRKNYGYAKDAVITLVPEVSHNYRGKRKAWYESVSAYAGKTVEEFTKNVGGDEKPRGWLRFFCEDGTVSLYKAS